MVLTDQGSDLQTRKAVRKEAKYLNWKKSQARCPRPLIVTQGEAAARR